MVQSPGSTNPAFERNTTRTRRGGRNMFSRPSATRSISGVHCAREFNRLGQEAGIDPSSMTDMQIIEALHQLR